MKEADIKIMQDAVADAVQKTVNGKIDGIKRHLEEQDAQFEKRRVEVDGRFEQMETKIDELKPVIEAQRTLFGLARFIKFIAVPASALYGIFKWIR